MSKNISKLRYYLVDALRGIAAIVVMLRHFSQHTTTPFFPNARIASDIFILAGGFMTAYAYHDKLNNNLSLRKFVLARLSRLYPLFILGWILGVTNLTLKIYYNQTNFTNGDALVSMLVNLFWLPYFGNNYVDIVLEKTTGAVFPGNDPTWALALIFWVSLFYALLTKLKSRYAYVVVIISSAIFLTLFVKTTYMAGPGWGSSHFHGGVFRALFCFFAGVFLYTKWDIIKPWIPVIKFPLLILPILLLILLAIPNFNGYYILWLGMIFIVVPLFVSLSIAATLESPFFKLMCTELGKLSYPIYCFHYPIFSIYSTFHKNKNLDLIEISILIFATAFLAKAVVIYLDEPISFWFKSKGYR